MAHKNDYEPGERDPILPDSSSGQSSQSSTAKGPSDDVDFSIVWAVLPTLLLVKKSPEFGALSDASWLITTYTLAQCACQPLYGKMSDIFGRKPLLAFSYIVFAIGCVLCGIGYEYWQVLAGRAISGIGGAGMVGLVAVVITDLLPPRQVAVWRSYVNVVATLGRSCGGPTGGWLVDNIGWRWCFLGQCPLAGVAIILILWRLPRGINSTDSTHENWEFRDKISRVDFAGFITIPAALIAAFLALDFAGKQYPWTYIVPLAVTAFMLFALFYFIERKYAQEPIIPIELISKRDVLVPYTLIAFQTAAPFIITYTIPIYFQIVTRMSATAAGSRIVFIVVGNTLGGLVTGWLISRTGRYKAIIIAATMLGIICYTLVLIRWHGTSSWLDTSYVILGGIGMGSTQNTTFVHLAASLDAKDISIAGTTWFLSQSIGMLVAANLFNAIHNVVLIDLLEKALNAVADKQKIIDGASSSVEYISSLPPTLRNIVTKAFVKSLVPSNALALSCGVVAMLTGLLVRERRLDKG